MMLSLTDAQFATFTFREEVSPMRVRMLLAAAPLVVLSQAPAWSGRAVTEDEKMKLVAALAAEGCSGGEMEFDDGLFEVETAKCRDGKQYDLVFDVNFKLVSKELSDD
jgi:hypothetical protein